MNERARHITNLLIKRMEGNIDASEAEELQQWAASGGLRNELYQEFSSEECLARLLLQWDVIDMNELQTKLRNSVATVQFRPVYSISFLKTTWLRYAAAIIIVCGIGGYLWNNYQKPAELNTATTTLPSQDILPGGQKAKLTLADGRVIILDSAANGHLASENGSNIIKRGDEIIYEYSDLSAKALPPSQSYGGRRAKGYDAGEVRTEVVAYNTMSTPRGGQYQLKLPDGTKVWLNAASSITYPTAFTGKTREVEIAGEVYFEVMKNPQRPFRVKISNEIIEVLGTSFNVNAYVDEPAMKVSLVAGKVKIREKVLQPGQAFVNGQVITTNLEQDIAWKNGMFYFEGADLYAVLRQLSRWYDIDVRYNGEAKRATFGGKLYRDLTLTQLTEILEQMNVHFRLQGRTLFVE